MAKKKKPVKQPKKPPAQPNPPQSQSGATGNGQPVFAQPKPSPDPSGFKNPVTDQKDVGIANLEPVPIPAGGAAEPILTLQQVWVAPAPV